MADFTSPYPDIDFSKGPKQLYFNSDLDDGTLFSIVLNVPQPDSDDEWGRTEVIALRKITDQVTQHLVWLNGTGGSSEEGGLRKDVSDIQTIVDVSTPRITLGITTIKTGEIKFGSSMTLDTTSLTFGNLFNLAVTTSPRNKATLKFLNDDDVTLEAENLNDKKIIRIETADTGSSITIDSLKNIALTGNDISLKGSVTASTSITSSTLTAESLTLSTDFTFISATNLKLTHAGSKNTLYSQDQELEIETGLDITLKAEGYIGLFPDSTGGTGANIVLASSTTIDDTELVTKRIKVSSNTVDHTIDSNGFKATKISNSYWYSKLTETSLTFLTDSSGNGGFFSSSQLRIEQSTDSAFVNIQNNKIELWDSGSGALKTNIKKSLIEIYNSASEDKIIQIDGTGGGADAIVVSSTTTPVNTVTISDPRSNQAGVSVSRGDDTLDVFSNFIRIKGDLGTQERILLNGTSNGADVLIGKYYDSGTSNIQGEVYVTSPDSGEDFLIRGNYLTTSVLQIRLNKIYCKANNGNFLIEQNSDLVDKHLQLKGKNNIILEAGNSINLELGNTSTDTINITNLPSASDYSDLSTGDLYQDSGTLKVVP